MSAAAEAFESFRRWDGPNGVKQLLGETTRPETVWRWERDGAFPKRIKIGPSAIGWRESELTEWARSPAAYREKHCKAARKRQRQVAAA